MKQETSQATTYCKGCQRGVRLTDVSFNYRRLAKESIDGEAKWERDMVCPSGHIIKTIGIL